MNFKTFQLIINGCNPVGTDIEKIVQRGNGKYEHGNEVYLIEQKNVDERYIWMYCQYENAKLYGEVVLDTKREIERKNTRKRNEIELRKQLFIIYDIEENLLYLSDMSKKSFVKEYLIDILHTEVIIKNIYASLEEFQNSIKRLKKLKFTQYYNVQNMLGDESIFLKEANALGLDLPNKITMQVEYQNSLIGNIKEGLQKIKYKKEKGYFEDIILIGEDDQGIEQNFNFSSLVKNIVINISKNENEQYDNKEVEQLFFDKIRS